MGEIDAGGDGGEVAAARTRGRKLDGGFTLHEVARSKAEGVEKIGRGAGFGGELRFRFAFFRALLPLEADGRGTEIAAAGQRDAALVEIEIDVGIGKTEITDEIRRRCGDEAARDREQFLFRRDMIQHRMLDVNVHAACASHLVDHQAIARSDLKIALVEHAHHVGQTAAARDFHVHDRASRREARKDDLAFVHLPFAQHAGRHINRQAVALEMADTRDARDWREVFEKDHACIFDRELKCQVFIRQEAFGICPGRPVDIEDSLGGLSGRDTVPNPQPRARAEIDRPEGDDLLRRDVARANGADFHAYLKRLALAFEPHLAGCSSVQSAGDGFEVGDRDAAKILRNARFNFGRSKLPRRLEGRRHSQREVRAREFERRRRCHVTGHDRSGVHRACELASELVGVDLQLFQRDLLGRGVVGRVECQIAHLDGLIAEVPAAGYARERELGALQATLLRSCDREGGAGWPAGRKAVARVTEHPGDRHGIDALKRELAGRPRDSSIGEDCDLDGVGFTRDRVGERGVEVQGNAFARSAPRPGDRIGAPFRAGFLIVDIETEVDEFNLLEIPGGDQRSQRRRQRRPVDVANRIERLVAGVGLAGEHHVGERPHALLRANDSRRAVLQAKLTCPELHAGQRGGIERDHGPLGAESDVVRPVHRCEALRDGFDTAAVAHPFEDEILDFHGLTAPRFGQRPLDLGPDHFEVDRSLRQPPREEARAGQNREDNEREDLDDEELWGNPQSVTPCLQPRENRSFTESAERRYTSDTLTKHNITD